MKLSGIALLAGLALSALGASPVVAQRHVEVHRTTSTTTVTNGGPRQMRRHKVCRTRWVHHRKVTRCYRR